MINKIKKIFKLYKAYLILMGGLKLNGSRKLKNESVVWTWLVQSINIVVSI